jgi:hypothetical protein
METLEPFHVLPAEHKLIDAITHADVSIDDVVSLGIDLGRRLQALDMESRMQVMTRLRNKATESRAAGDVTDAVLIELVLRSLQRFLR